MNFIYRRNAEMEKEIADLRRRLGPNSDQEQGLEHHESQGGDDISHCSEDVFARRDSAAIDRSRPVSVPVENSSIATPLTIKRDGSIVSQDEGQWRLEDISLSRARILRLYEQYATTPCCDSYKINIDLDTSHIITLFCLF